MRPSGPIWDTQTRQKGSEIIATSKKNEFQGQSIFSLHSLNTAFTFMKSESMEADRTPVGQ